MPDTSDLIEIPKLNLALKGFSLSQQVTLTQWLEDEAQTYTDSSDIAWTISPMSEADAVLQAHSSSPDIASTDISRKLPSAVFWESPQQQASETLDVSREHFLLSLIELSQSMQPACLRYTLASMLIERYEAHEPMTGLWHVSKAGALLGVVDFQRLEVAIRGDTHYLELINAAWERRSYQAIAPADFEHGSIECLLWHYTRRTERQVLPLRYLQHPVSLRRLPRLPLALVGEQMLVAITMLRSQSMSIKELSERMGLPKEQVKRLLATLHFSSAITTSPVSPWRRLINTLRRQPISPFTESTRPASQPFAVPEGASLYAMSQPPKLLR
jgi:hypothetical protein